MLLTRESSYDFLLADPDDDSGNVEEMSEDKSSKSEEKNNGNEVEMNATNQDD